MATCHAIALIDNVPAGDPLEVELLRASGYSLESPSESAPSCIMRAYKGGAKSNDNKYEVLRHFEFTSDKARAGSLVKRPTGDVIYYSKGSPEAILKLAKKSSVPIDINDTLNNLSKRGLRVIAMSYRIISTANSVEKISEDLLLAMPQRVLEEESVFLGLAFLSNALKSETISTIKTLRNADIKCNMITGDHIHTAIAIATDCGLLVASDEVFIIDADDDSPSGLTISITSTGVVVSTNIFEFLTSLRDVVSQHVRLHNQQHHHTQLAVTGRGLDTIKKRHSHLVKILLESTQVFARMKPSDKQFIVEELQRLSEKEALEMFNDDHTDANKNDSKDGLQITSEQDEEEGGLRKSMMKGVISALAEDGRGSLHVLFCGDGNNN
jgi:magnesium-transporting ATPase (P-type)